MENKKLSHKVKVKLSDGRDGVITAFDVTNTGHLTVRVYIPDEKIWINHIVPEGLANIANKCDFNIDNKSINKI